MRANKVKNTALGHLLLSGLAGIVLLVIPIAGQANERERLLRAHHYQLPNNRKQAAGFHLEDLHNNTYRFSPKTGQLVLIHFWATWCAPCLQELPLLEKLWQQYRDRGLLVLAVNVNRGFPEHVRGFVQKNQLSMPVLLDPDGLVRHQYDMDSLPTSYLIDPNGIFIGRLNQSSDWPLPLYDKLLQMYRPAIYPQGARQ